MNLTIEAANIEELKAKIQEVANGLGITTSVMTTTESTSGYRHTVHVPEEPVKEKKPRAAKKVEAAPELPVVSPKSSAPTKEQAIEALTKVNSVRGTSVARDTLLKFKAERFSDLKSDTYQTFIDECNQITANA